MFQNGNPKLLSSIASQLAIRGLKVPRYADGPRHHVDLGASYLLQGEFSKAIDCYHQALQFFPHQSELWCNLGYALLFSRNLNAAARCFRRALVIDHGCFGAHFGLAHGYLSQGLYRAGWPHYERRRKKAMPMPQWQGQELRGQRILLHAEQGLGDSLQFARYVPLVAARGGRVVLHVQPQLRRLLTSINGIEEFLADDASVDQISCHCPLPSLPGVFRTQLSTIPSQGAYLTPNRAAVESWLARLAGLGLKVGLAWAGDPRHGRDLHRSVSLPMLEPVLHTSGVSFFSLQRGAAVEQIAQLPDRITVREIEDQCADFADTAAAITALDLVITVDTSIAHLAGALGKPVWVMLPFVPDWRWLLTREDSPWYETARLFRQDSPGEWDGVMMQVAAQLQLLAASHAPNRPQLL
jgi:hypothetical protein